MSLFGLLKVKLSSLIKTLFKKKRSNKQKERNCVSRDTSFSATLTQTDFHLIPEVATRGRHLGDAVHWSLALTLFLNFFLPPLTLSLTSAQGRCPPLINCARLGREFCTHGSTHCGRCLSALVENEEGLCVAKKTKTQKSTKLDSMCLYLLPSPFLSLSLSVLSHTR